MLHYAQTAPRKITYNAASHQDDEFILVQPPILTSNDCEGAGEAFRITTDELLGSALSDSSRKPAEGRSTTSRIEEFFDKPTYLTVSTQLHLEALASALSRVYTMSPVFRAEPSQTHRHASEFSMLEAELSFCNDLEDVMSFVERSLKKVIASIRTTAAPEIQAFQEMQLKYGGHPVEEIPAPGSFTPIDLLKIHSDVASDRVWARLTYHQAMEELQAYSSQRPGAFRHPVGLGLPLQSEHEKWLSGTLVGGPVFVTDYPAEQKPFYMRSNEDGAGTVSCFDLLVPNVGELVGGSLREERSELLEAAMKRQGIALAGMEWYLDLRKYGSVPHGGFGLGFERLISWLTGFENIRECMPFPRSAGKILL